MSTTFQISDKRNDAILLVKVETDELNTLALGQAEEAFAAAVGLVGLGPAYESFGASAPATIPDVRTLTRGPQQPYQPPAQEPWGQPPVPPMQPQQQFQQTPPQQQYAPVYQHPAAQQAAPPAAGAPQCQHGVKEFISGTSQKTGKPWKAWACPADRNDPTKCEKDWIR